MLSQINLSSQHLKNQQSRNSSQTIRTFIYNNEWNQFYSQPEFGVTRKLIPQFRTFTSFCETNRATTYLKFMVSLRNIIDDPTFIKRLGFTDNPFPTIQKSIPELYRENSKKQFKTPEKKLKRCPSIEDRISERDQTFLVVNSQQSFNNKSLPISSFSKFSFFSFQSSANTINHNSFKSNIEISNTTIETVFAYLQPYMMVLSFAYICRYQEITNVQPTSQTVSRLLAVSIMVAIKYSCDNYQFGMVEMISECFKVPVHTLKELQHFFLLSVGYYLLIDKQSIIKITGQLLSESIPRGIIPQ